MLRIQFVKLLNQFALALAAFLVPGFHAFAWDYAGHAVINRLALSSLPTNFPAFVQTLSTQERIAFLGGEPDRWRNTPDLALQHANGPDHYIDLEELKLYELTPDSLPPLRYDMVAQIARIRAKYPSRFPPIDPSQDKDHTRELVGFVPWTITEYYAKLKSEFSYLKTFQQFGGTPGEIASSEANIIYTMGVMGHFVGDGSQPLHSTIHHHGWVGENPHGYTTNRAFHSWIDGGYLARIGGLKSETLLLRIRPAEHIGDVNQPDGFFRAMVNYLQAGNAMVEPLYQLEKEQKLSSTGEIDPAGKAFLENQIVKGAQMLGNIWFSAWQDATVDKYLRKELENRFPK